MLDNARHLAWGYVSYPPLTAFIARVALTLFGPSLAGVRFFSSLAMALAVLLAGLMAREMGGRRWAQVAAAVAVLVAPFPMLAGVLFHYSSFDALWWVLIAYFVVRLLKSEDERWWLAIGATIGLAMLTKYTAAFLVAGIVAGVLLTPARRYLKSRWLWAGVGLSLLIALPNLIWLAQHNFIYLNFARAIHTRDINAGRTEGFILEQFLFATNPVTIPLWVVGLYYYFFSAIGRKYRMIGWMFVIPLLFFLYTKARSYYFAPAYPMLFAGGTVMAQHWLERLSARGARIVQGLVLGLFTLGGIVMAPVALPLIPVNSPAWSTVSDINGELNEMIGWPELVETVAGIYASLPPEQRATTAIYTGNYGEAGAIDLYGPAYGLPQAISGVNSYWYRGYGDPPPEQVIALGMSYGQALSLFNTCKQVGRVTNDFGVNNEESRSHPLIFLCSQPRLPWPELWKMNLWFG
jgi:4-amino-4-deoxy-L-arabinose transferase-like glycosyltransferase